MNRKMTVAIVTASLSFGLALTGCANSEAPEVEAEETVSEEQVTPSEEPTEEEPVSDIEAAVQTFVTALDNLGIEHSEPVRAEVGLSGAQARFDITVNGYDAGINVFGDAGTLETWGEASDSFGGIYVESGLAVLTLNSSEGIANSAEIAPLIAAEVGGEAHGV